MKQTEITLVRHAETEWNTQRRFQGHKDSELTELGWKQVSALGKSFRYESFDRLYSSDLPRSRKTAEAIAAHHQHSILFDERLREKNLGIFEGLDVPEIRERFGEAYAAFKSEGPGYQIEEGESTFQLQQRALAFVEDVQARHAGESIVLVTHGGVVRVLLKHILGISLDTPTRFRIQNTSIHRLVLEKEYWMVSTLGEVSHLNGVRSAG